MEVHNRSKKYIDSIDFAYNDCINNTKITKSEDAATTGLLAAIELYNEEFSKIYNNFEIKKLATSLQVRIHQTVDEHKRQLLGTNFHFVDDRENSVGLFAGSLLRSVSVEDETRRLICVVCVVSTCIILLHRIFF